MGAYDLLARYMNTVVNQTVSRTVGNALMHINVLTTLAYWQDPRAHADWGDYTVKVITDRTGAVFAPWYAYRVDGVRIGEGWTVSLYFWGETPGINTIISRYQFWKLYIISAIRINLKNRLAGATGQAFVPMPQRVGVLTERPIYTGKLEYVPGVPVGVTASFQDVPFLGYKRAFQIDVPYKRAFQADVQFR